MDNGTVSSILRELEAGYNLPALSPVALKLVEMATDESCSAADLARMIEKDPSLAVRLLKLANSAAFRSQSPAATLEQAVVKIGFHRLRVMGLSLSLRDTFPMGKKGSMDYERFWRSSLYRALLAKHLAWQTRTCNPDEAFVAGLILEIGLLIFYDLLIKEKEKGILGEVNLQEMTLTMERDRYGLDHRQVGEVALRHWKFPESIVSCQRKLREHSTEAGRPELGVICELAGALTDIMLEGDREFGSLFEEAEASCGLAPDGLNDILLETFEQVQDIADQLRLSLDREEDLLELMEKANRALSHISEKISGYDDKRSGKPLPTFETLPENGGDISRTLQAVAHEIRNPLLAVGGFAKRLATALDPSTEGGKYARFILEEAARLEQALSKMTAPETGESQ